MSLSFSAFVLTAILKDKMGLATVPAALLGGLGGFLVYNFYPAKVFMGDTGSLFFGSLVIGTAFMMREPIVIY